ncbi:hypothetical protein NKJ28_14480 [Mesorhizobium sp. M0145]|uniref:hypothetical protein n=1 Tax=Mesorhizobium sp. M0145 TaxID=2956895 RepID=UPI00333AA650
MPYVDISRRFSKWRDENASDEDFALFERSFVGEATWDELLKYQRVILLAEAGSGKSRELGERAKRLAAAGEFAFHATVQNVAKESLAGALDGPSRARLEGWQNSEATGWFFIDSVDEAKLDHIRFVDALRKIGDGLGNGLPRARIIISGRYTGWEFRADLQRLKEVLPVARHTDAGQIEPDQVLGRILRNEIQRESRAEKPEQPLVVLMAPLDRDQVRLFAQAQGVQQLDEFMSALDHDNLWHFAKRPLDLGWLVDYWRKNQRFGRFAEMLEASARARLQEENPEHGSRDEIDIERGMAALERIAATMVFGRNDRIEIPDTELTLEASNAFRLRNILPDWPTEQLPMLLSRSAFDPASLGQVRLHNDNEGVVRGFLAARWLQARLEANAPRSRVFALLFGDADGTPIVLPSAKETAAWLSAWNGDVAREVIRRDPSLLLTAGDPTSLSTEIRQAVLEATFTQLAAGVTRYRRLDPDVVRRFSNSDIVPALKAGWSKHGDRTEVRRLILNMIDAGRLSDAVDIARIAVNGEFSDITTLVLGTRALGVVGEPSDLASLAKEVLANSSSTDPTAVWEALDVLWPRHLSVDGFLSLIQELKKKGDRAEQFGWRGKGLIERLESRSGLKALVKGLLDMLGEEPDEDEDRHPDEKRLQPLLQAAATALLKQSPRKVLDPFLVDAALRLNGDRMGVRRFEDQEFQPLLHASAERRRIGLWHAVEKLRDHPRVQKMGLTNMWQLDIVGWSSGLREEDIPWLLDDARQGDTPQKRRLALSALMSLWRDTGKSDELLARIKGAAEKAQESDYLEAWLKPPELSKQEIEHRKEMDRLTKKREREEKERDKSWFEFIDRLKADPEQLRTPPPDLKAGNVDGRLFYIWELLHAATSERTGYAIDSFGPLADVLGPHVTREATMALTKFWRTHKPTLTSSRPAEKRNVGSKLDSMGIVGISLEAKADSRWAHELTSEEATIAAQLSTLELNGFPHWLSQLVEVWPDEVAVVFVHEIMDHLTVVPDQHGFLDKAAYADAHLASLVAPALLKYVFENDDLGGAPLKKAFNVIGRALPEINVSLTFTEMTLARFASAQCAEDAALYLGFAMRTNPEASIEALSSKLDALKPTDQRILSEHVLPAIFGDQWLRGGMNPGVLPFPVLERLVRIAFRTIRHDEDIQHEGVYSPGARDHAEGARSSLFKQLCETPGHETLEALKRIGADPDLQFPAERLRELAYDRASADAEHEPWPAFEAFELEREFDTAPRTPRDLQLVALSRIAEMNDDLHNHRFSQGKTVKRLLKEEDVQKWLAWELERAGGRAYSLEREPHVVDEKEPDIRLQSKVTDASLPLEIKVAESWSLRQLEDALTLQLSGRYLRQRDHRHGVLVLVHKEARAEGWEDDSGIILTFPQVFQRLKGLAYRLETGGIDAARAEIAVIDVSDIVIPDPPKRKKRNSKVKTRETTFEGHASRKAKPVESAEPQSPWQPASQM